MRLKVAGFFIAERGAKMTTYEFLQNQKNYCQLMARTYASDKLLHTFYTKAAEGYKIKLQKLTVSEAAK